MLCFCMSTFVARLLCHFVCVDMKQVLHVAVRNLAAAIVMLKVQHEYAFRAAQHACLERHMVDVEGPD